ncbi:hypothetical protein PC123_g21849 [Phytophthora cactorum]|nr:hypothetical protein PC120_g21316 [Phytophthora cactorum]KAG4042668.1 hypothetical protein PC123_g21849 [Phytophthora cactorum]
MLQKKPQNVEMTLSFSSSDYLLRGLTVGEIGE